METQAELDRRREQFRRRDGRFGEQPPKPEAKEKRWPTMSPHIDDILDTELMERDISDGYISIRRHPEFPSLCIANYTPKATYTNHWDEATINCRGLIYDESTGEIVARPYKKFFNLGLDTELPGGPVMFLEKLDGYLGVSYQRPDGRWSISSRGSFDSEMARRANEILKKTGLDVGRHDGYTDMFEILYPERPLVVDYGDRERLVYTGSVERATGKWKLFDDYDDSAQLYHFESVQQMLEAPQSSNMEGYVLAWPQEHQTLIKVKFDEYLTLSRAIQSNSAKRIIQALSGGQADQLRASVEKLPSAVRRIVEKNIADIQAQFNSDYRDLRAEIDPILAHITTLPDRATIGSYVAKSFPKNISSAVFTAMKGESELQEYVWKKLVLPETVPVDEEDEG